MIDDIETLDSHLCFPSGRAKQYLRQVLALDGDLLFSDGPHLAQCAGTRRLWGAAMGAAFALDAHAPEKQSEFEQIALLSRAYLVVQDHLMDEHLEPERVLACKSYLARLDAAIVAPMMRVGASVADFREQCRSGWAAYEERKSNSFQGDLLQNAKDKCAIFFNPFGLTMLTEKFGIPQSRLSFLNTFFDLCQTLDDFHDMNEDSTEKRVNQNLFLFGRSPTETKLIQTLRPVIAPMVIDYIDRRLSEHTTDTQDNEILDFFGNSGRSWVLQKRSIFGQETHPTNALRWLNSPPFVDCENSIPATTVSDEEYLCHVEKLRPEYLQTEMAGFNSIDEIQSD